MTRANPFTDLSDFAPKAQGKPVEAKQIDHPEIIALLRRIDGRQERLPFGVLRQIGALVALEQAEEHLGDYAAADRTEPLAVFSDRRFAEDVEPERRAVVKAERLQLGKIGL